MEERFKRDLGLQLLAIYLLFVAPIFVLAIIFYQGASNRLEQDVAAADLSLARSIALETDAFLMMAKEAVAAFAKMPPIIRADARAMEGIFAAASSARQDVNLFYRLSAEGVMLYHYPPLPRSTVGQDFSFRGYFQKAKSSGKHVFSKGRISPTTEQAVVTSVMPIFTGGQFRGVIATNLVLQRLTETLHRIVLTQPNAGDLQIIIVDSAGQAIAHSEPERLLVELSDAMPVVSQVLDGREGTLIAADAQGQEWLYSYTPIPIAGWGVIVQRPTHQAFASISSFQRGGLLALALFSGGAFIFWLFLSKRVIIPLEQLTRYGDVVGREGVDDDADRQQIMPLSRRADHVGLLTRSLLRAETYIWQRMNDLTTLNKTSAAVISTLDTNQVIAAILDETQRLLSIRKCALLILDPAKDSLKIQASRGLSTEYAACLEREAVSKDLPAYRAIQFGHPVQVSDIVADRTMGNICRLLQKEEIHSLLTVPISAPHIPPAALTIYRSDAHQFTEREMGLATSFANQAAIALEHATLFSLTSAELQKRVQFLSALNRIARTVSQSLVVDEVLENALEAMMEVMPIDACWIYLQRPAEIVLRLRAQRGLPADLNEALRARRVKLGEGIIGQVYQANAPFLLNRDNLQEQKWREDPLIAGQNWQSLAAAPLTVWGSAIGVLGMAAHAADSFRLRSRQAFDQSEADLLQAIGDQVAIAVANARLYRRSREAAALEERNRVAREIHDTLAQGFTGILLQLQAAERLSLKRPEQAVQSLQEAQNLARQSLQEARRSVLNLRPAGLENFSLDEAIEQQVENFGRKTGIKTRFTREGYASFLDPEAERNLYRIAQESLTNVSRHAQASRVTVTLRYAPQSVTLIVEDNGIGFDPVAAGKSGGFGLISIRERVNLMKGQVEFSTPPGGGTRVTVSVPGE